MKYLSKFLLGAILGLALLTSCNKKEGCTEKGAENYDPSAERENGTCILQRTKFLGLYQVNESWTRNGVPQPTISYTTIVRSTNDNLTDIFIDNLHDKYKVRLRVNGNRLDFVQPTYIPGFESNEIGGGTILNNQISLRYSLTDYSTGSLTLSNCNATFSK